MVAPLVMLFIFWLEHGWRRLGYPPARMGNVDVGSLYADKL